MYRSLTVQSFALSIVLITALIFMGCDDSVVDPDPDPDPDEGITLTGEVVAPQGDAAAAAEQTNADRSSQENNDDQVADDELDVREATPSDEQNLAADVQSAVLAGETPVADATVEIFDLAEYTQNPATAEPVATTTTDGDGQYEADNVPEDIDLLILVDTEPRLASLAYEVDENASGDVSTATTLAAERWGPDLLDGASVSEEEIEQTIEVAIEELDGKDGAALEEILNGLVPEDFGDGFPRFPTSALQEFILTFQGIDSAVCSDVELAETSARPTNEVGLTDMADAFGDEPWGWLYDAEIESPDEDDLVLVYVERTNGQEGVLVAPLHPADYMEGGSAYLALFDEDETFTCPHVEFEIEPLDPAPDVLEVMVDEMEALFEEQAAVFEADPGELRTLDVTALDEVDRHLAPLAAGLQLIDGPNYENNLRARLEGDAPMLDGEPLDPEALGLIGALMSETGATGFFETVQPNALAPKLGSPDPCPSPFHEIRNSVSTPDVLDCYMDQQAHYDELRGYWESYRDPHDKVLAVMGELFDPADIPGLRIGEAVSGAESVNQFIQMMADFFVNALPSELIGIDLDASPTTFREDDDLWGSWGGELVAKGEEWTFDVLLAAEMSPIGPGRGSRALSRMRGHSETVQKATEEITDQMVSEAQETGIGEIDFGPNIFEVDIDPNREDPEEEIYFSWELQTDDTEIGDAPFQFLDDDESRYEPNSVGTSLLQVRTQGGDVFQGKDAVNNEFLEVKGIEIDIIDAADGSSPPFELDPDESLSIDVKAVVDNAEDDDAVTWESEGDEGSFAQDQGAEVTYTAPAEEGTYLLIAESVAEGGAREHEDAPSRTATAQVIVGDDYTDQDLEITPITGCLTVDESHPFSATLDGMDISFSELDWTIDGSGDGTLGNDGVFTPTSTGEVDIEIWPQGDTDAAVELSFLIQDNCGEMVVDVTLNEDGSAPVEYQHESTCVAGRAFTDPSGETASVFLTRKAPLGGVGGLTKVELNMFSFDISDGDEWTASAEGAMSIRNIDEDEIWAIPFVEFSVVKEQLTIQTNGGEEVIPVFSGSWPEHTMDVDDGTVTVAGEFSNVRYGEDGCGPLSHPAWDEIIDGL